MNMRQCLLPVLACLTLMSCGGGGSSTSSSTGLYIDAPTQGLTYSASPSGLSGTTSSTGGFSYVSGDTVTFSYTANGVTIPMGSITPSPSSTGGQAIVSVLTLPNGNEIAQAIQSIAVSSGSGASAVLNLSGGSVPTSANALAVKNFINSGGTTTTPSGLTNTWVSADAALYSALAFVSAGGIPTQTVPSLTTLISGNTYFTSNTYTSNSAQKFANAGIQYFAANGTYYNLCVNAVFVDTSVTNPNLCANNNGVPVPASGDWGTGTWAVPATANTFTLTGTEVGHSTYVTTVTLPIIDSVKGLFTTSQTNNGNPVSGTSAGKFHRVQNTFSINSLANKTFVVSGKSVCSDGLLSYAFGSITGSSVSYSATCPGGYASGGAVTGTASNATSGVTTIPGVVKFDENTGYSGISFVGLTEDSSSSSGVVLIAKVGDPVTCGSNPSHCGSLKTKSFTLH